MTNKARKQSEENPFDYLRPLIFYWLKSVQFVELHYRFMQRDAMWLCRINSSHSGIHMRTN